MTKRESVAEKAKRFFSGEKERNKIEIMEYEIVKLATMADIAEAAKAVVKDYGEIRYFYGAGDYWNYWKEQKNGESFRIIKKYDEFVKSAQYDINEILNALLSNPEDVDFLCVFSEGYDNGQMQKIRSEIQEKLEKRLAEIKKDAGLDNPEKYALSECFVMDFEPRDVMDEGDMFRIIDPVSPPVNNYETDSHNQAVIVEFEPKPVSNNYEASKYVKDVLIEGMGILIYENQPSESKKLRYDAYRKAKRIRKVDDMLRPDHIQPLSKNEEAYGTAEYRDFIMQALKVMPEKSEQRRYVESICKKLNFEISRWNGVVI